jgi:hypothetical protein
MLSKRAVLIRVDEVVGKVFGESLGNGVGRNQLRKKGKKSVAPRNRIWVLSERRNATTRSTNHYTSATSM